ncbi:MAG: RelA/SpoT domain-containing protein, partial [Gammaproteobacteria bacterium]|nr:RelA/SpoT domain-containing protein [Gammaproteobacteria bacterium]
YALQQLYQRSRSCHEFMHEDDYIKTPKMSGYRCLHLVYRFNSETRTDYNGLLVKIQLRTEIQHAWATAVETVGAFLGQALKASEGEHL